LLATAKHYLVPKGSWPIFEEPGYSGSHVFGLKQCRGDLIGYPVGGTDAAVEICSNDPLANGVGQSRATGESLSKGPCF
jgi:hypothetical protein